MIYIIAILWYFGFLYWDVKSDYKKWLQQLPVKHGKEAVQRGLLLMPSFILLMWNTDWTIWNGISALLLMGSAYWELFDGWYNKLRGFKWRFNGSVDPDDSLLDKFLYKIGDTWEGVLKIGLILASLTFYLLTL